MSTQPPEDDRAALRAFALLGSVFAIGVVIWLVCTLKPGPAIPRDGSSLVLGRDFLNFWMYGRAAGGPDPGRWYDAGAYQQALGALLGQDYPGQNWSYPPSVMLLAAPFGRMPYIAALAIWTALGLLVLAAALRRNTADLLLLAGCMAAPAGIFCLISGQSSLLTTAMLLGIFALLDCRPLVAGLLIGCLTLKPQLGLLFPVLLIASGRWRVFATASVTTLTIAAITIAAFGFGVWIDFVQKALPVQNLVLSDPDGIATPFYATIFMNLRGIGLPYGAAMVVQSAVALAAAVAVWWAFRTRRDADPQMLTALFLACSIAATPYLLSYDTLALSVLVLRLIAAGQLDARGRILAKLVFWLPLVQMAFGILHVPGPAFIAPAFALFVVARLRSSESQVAVDTQTDARAALA